MPTYTVAPLAIRNRKVRENRMALTPVLDRPLSTPTLLTVSGHVTNASTTPVEGATVLLFRQSDNVFIGQTTTDVNGWYSFNRRSDDTALYYTVGFTVVNGVTQIHGTSNRDLVAV